MILTLYLVACEEDTRRDYVADQGDEGLTARIKSPIFPPGIR